MHPVPDDLNSFGSSHYGQILSEYVTFTERVERHFYLTYTKLLTIDMYLRPTKRI